MSLYSHCAFHTHAWLHCWGGKQGWGSHALTLEVLNMRKHVKSMKFVPEPVWFQHPYSSYNNTTSETLSTPIVNLCLPALLHPNHSSWGFCYLPPAFFSGVPTINLLLVLDPSSQITVLFTRSVLQPTECLCQVLKHLQGMARACHPPLPLLFLCMDCVSGIPRVCKYSNTPCAAPYSCLVSGHCFLLQ